MTDTITLPRSVIERTIKCLSYPDNPGLRLVLRDLFAVLEQQEKQQLHTLSQTKPNDYDPNQQLTRNSMNTIKSAIAEPNGWV